MHRRWLTASVSLLALFALSGCAGPPESYTVDADAKGAAPGSAEGASWLAWGGPGGDFKVDVEGLADAWPPAGPPLIWSRALGAGYSAIAADRGALFTMYRDEDHDVAISLRADDGSTIWEHRYRAPTREQNDIQFGKGPNATPLVLGDRVVTLGYTGMLHCLDRATGEVVWSHDLIGDFGGEVLPFGYSASPIAHEGNVIVLVGGEAQGAMALSPENGSVVWRGKQTGVSYATPVVIDVDGQEQLVYFSAEEVIGLEAGTGAFLWSFPVLNQYRNNSTGPHWGEDNLLWVATQLDGGTRALRLTRDGDSTHVEEVWKSDRLSIHFWNTLLLDDHVYASIGSNASVLAAVDLRTGDIRWRERGFEQVNFIHAGAHTLMFDANGHLALAALSPEGIQIRAQSQIVEGPAWTVPTLVGTRLFLRDLQSIRALELGS